METNACDCWTTGKILLFVVLTIRLRLGVLFFVILHFVPLRCSFSLIQFLFDGVRSHNFLFSLSLSVNICHVEDEKQSQNCVPYHHDNVLFTKIVYNDLNLEAKRVLLYCIHGVVIFEADGIARGVIDVFHPISD